VDRHLEQQTVLRAMEDARRQSGSVVLITGEAGVGKTRFCVELLARQRRTRALVLKGSPSAEACQPTLTAVADSLRVVDAAVRSRVWRALAARARCLSAVLPELVEPGEPAAAADDPLVFQALVEATAEAAGDTSVIWLLDDMQRADLATWHFLWYLCRHVDGRRFLVLASCRDDDVVAAQVDGPPLLAICSDLGAIEVHLDRLGRADTARLARAPAGADLLPSAIDRIVERSAGNARTVLELVEAAVAGRPDRVPPSIRHTVARRLSTLSPAAVEMLQALSVMEPEPDLRLVLAMPRATDAALAELNEAGLVRLAGDQRWPAVRFRHPLYRDAMREETTWAHRRAVHAQVARVTERLDGERDVGRILATARHWELGGDPGRAVQHLTAAARTLRAAGESRAARDLVLAKLQTLDRNPGIAGSRPRVVLSTMQELSRGGQWTELLPIVQRAWRSPSNQPGRENGRLAAILGTSLLMTGRVEESDALLATQTRQRERSGRARAAPSLLAAAAAAALYRGNPARARAFCEEALRTDEPAVRGFAGCLAVILRFRSERDREAAAEEFGALSDGASAEGQSELAAFALWNQARMTTRIEDALRAEAIGDRCNPLVAALSRMLVGEIHLLEGRESRAAAALDRARSELGASVPLVMPVLDGLQAHVHLHLADLAQARSRLDRWVGEQPEMWSLARAVLLGAHGWLAWESDSLDAAVERWGKCVEECAVSGYGLLDTGPLQLPLHVDALLRLGRAADAHGVVQAAETVSEPDRFFRASLAAARFRLAPSLESWSWARGLAAAAPWPLLEARLGCWCAEYLGNHSAGQAGVRLASAIGARLTAERTTRVLAAQTAPGPRPGENCSRPRLSARELQVAVLVADGLSNAAIAGRLNVSAATVTTHVKNILAKLDFHSRAQVAAWVSEQRVQSWENDVLLRLGRKVLR
jgi:DNA-binding CsgD family transcriptional regulator